LSIGKEEAESELGGSSEDVSDTDQQGLQRCGGFEKISPICSQEKIGMYYCSRGIKSWGEEPLEVPRLKDERLNPDWVEWLMGYPISWTDGGSRMQRLMALGNSVVPLIPEFLGQSITYHYNNIS
jgi:site-specific DNA-cytosine methylase